MVIIWHPLCSYYFSPKFRELWFHMVHGLWCTTCSLHLLQVFIELGLQDTELLWLVPSEVYKLNLSLPALDSGCKVTPTSTASLTQLYMQGSSCVELCGSGHDPQSLRSFLRYTGQGAQGSAVDLCQVKFIVSIQDCQVCTSIAKWCWPHWLARSTNQCMLAG